MIDRSLPRYDRDAGSRATWQYIDLLLSMGFRVIAWGHDFLRREPYASLLEKMGVEVLAGRHYACGGWKKWLKTNADAIDYVIVHRPNIAIHYLDFARRVTRAKILYFGHDLRWLRNARRYEVEKDGFFLSEAAYWKTIEGRLTRIVDAVYYFSEVEAEEVRKMVPEAQVRVVPLFLVADSATHDTAPFSQREGLLFVGGFAHAPNLDGILWFVEAVLPLLRQCLAEVKLTVVGANPPAQLHGVPGVLTVGAITDAELTRLYNRTRVVVAHLRYGAGIKGKVVEAICQKVPTVTTSIGAEGLPDARSVLDIAAQPQQYAEAVSKLYLQPDLWSQRSTDMGRYLGKHFSHASARRILQQDLQL